MKKLLLTALLVMSPIINAAETQTTGIYFTDIMFYRPGGFLLTIGGSALFLAMTPFTALAAISPPHDAFEKIGDQLVVAPFEFTFDRPLGVITRDPDGVYRR